MERLHYTARLHGVKLLDVDFCLVLQGDRYLAGLSARTVGVADWIAHARAVGRAAGHFAGDAVKPAGYEEQGRLSGEDHRVVIDYPAGAPVLRVLAPPAGKYRLAVPPSDLAGAIDGPSAVALESVAVSRTGGCDGQVLVFDGFQLRRATSRSAGHDVLAPSSRSVFAGPALRCQTESAMLAGFLKNVPVAGQMKPRHSTVWLAPLSPGGLALPVRMVFDADLLGSIVVDLDAASHDLDPVCGALPP
jgi:hypothetical protein